MNSRTEALVHLVMAIMIILVLSVAVYYIGGNFIGGDIIAKAEAGVKAGTIDPNTVHIPKLPDWKDQYFELVEYMGIIAGFILILWVALTHWLIRPSGSTGHGKRWLWVLLGIILATLCAAFPRVYVEYISHPPFLIDLMSLPLLFFVFYCLVGYWGGSIFVTSNTYKYTPIFAGFFW